MTKLRRRGEGGMPFNDSGPTPPGSKPADYHRQCRKEILPFLERGTGSILDIGCGEGATAAYLREHGYCRWAAGIELSPQAAVQAKERLDVVITGDIEELELPFDDESMDVILCLDVLEHLLDPWRLIDRLTKLLKPDGAIIASIPNVQHWSVVLPLVFRGHWEYRPEGILDATHLRFFTRESAMGLLQRPGLHVDLVHPLVATRFQSRLARLGLGDFMAVQYLIRARRTGAQSHGPDQ